MKLEQDTFRIELRSAKLCVELDCNTVFDARMYRHCPTCASVESYPLETWLNRERSRKPVRATFSVDAAPSRRPARASSNGSAARCPIPSARRSRCRFPCGPSAAPSES